MAGYRNDFSMSNNAYYAYEAGEKPLTKWTKESILNEIFKQSEENDIKIDFDALKKLKKSQLAKCLERTSWHHTSSYFNKTAFYAVNIDLIGNCFAQIEKAAASKEAVEKKFGNIYYLEWTGTRNHPKATECCYENIWIEEKGCFYICYKQIDDKDPFFKKKIGSNGTKVSFF